MTRSCIEDNVNFERLNKSKEFYEQWVTPVYLSDWNSIDIIPKLLKMDTYINIKIVGSMIIATDWRQRRVGANLAALYEYQSLEDKIGKVFLKPNNSYVSDFYAYALVIFNTQVSRGFLEQYLDYYLTREHNACDHRGVISAMAAICYLDNINQTTQCDVYMPSWRQWNLKHNYDLKAIADTFEKYVNRTLELRALLNIVV